MRKNMNDSGVSPVIAVILMVAITVVLAGVLYLWVSSLADTDEDTDFLDVSAEANAGATLTIKVNSGTITWSEYRVVFNGTTVTTTAVESSAAETASFDISAGTEQAGDEVLVNIVNIENNKIAWEKEIIVKA